MQTARKKHWKCHTMQVIWKFPGYICIQHTVLDLSNYDKSSFFMTVEHAETGMGKRLALQFHDVLQLLHHACAGILA